MKFRSELIIAKSTFQIDHATTMLSIGSCFASEIGKRLTDARFDMLVNPFGTIFNPHSMAELISGNEVQPDLFVQKDQKWCHFQLHSNLNNTDLQELKDQLSELRKMTLEKLAQTDVLILTFGSAWVYRHVESNKIVANCHKVPQQQFKKELLNLEELKHQYISLFDQLKSKNQKLRIILTVSPVKYLKDGVHENNLSKSILLLLCDFLVKRFDFVFYFPAFELVNDDLRDYRFYKEDLAHPNELAINYVFEKFGSVYFSDKTNEAIHIADDILRLKNHRPFDGINTDKKEKIQMLEKKFTLVSGLSK